MPHLYWALWMLSGSALAQSTGTLSQEARAVMTPVYQLFEGMQLGDSSMVRNAFYENPALYTAYETKDGEAVLKRGSLLKFLVAVGTPHDVVWDEPIWDTEVRIDGNLAQVWTQYAFYAGTEFSHCGVDAFHLTKTGKGWKIFHLTDTRRKEGCQVPEEIKNAREN